MKISSWQTRQNISFIENTLIESPMNLALVHTDRGEKVDRLVLTLTGDGISYRVTFTKEEVAQMLEWYQKTKEG